jgi:outer membrane receptor protein involved in Fe transport
MPLTLRTAIMVKTFAYQFGLRFEHSEFKGEMIDSAKKFGYEYPSSIENLFDALFPSIFLTKELKEGTEIQLNYTRRVRRPNFWQLNPYVNINDPVNLEVGNPQLRPEYTNSIEFNFNRTYSSGNFLAVLYFQNNQLDITRYSDTISAELYQELNNAANRSQCHPQYFYKCKSYQPHRDGTHIPAKYW